MTFAKTIDMGAGAQIIEYDHIKPKLCFANKLFLSQFSISYYTDFS